MNDDELRAKIADVLAASDVGGDALKKILGDRRHRVIAVWAEEKAEELRIFNTVPLTPEGVVEVADGEIPANGRSYKPRWEPIGAIVFGDASRSAVERARGLYEEARGIGGAKERYVGRASPPGPNRRSPNPAGT